MFGPLPRGYRVAMVATSVALFVLVGAWLGQRTTLVVPPWGTLLGVLAGSAVAFVLVHDFHRRNQPQPRHVRHR